MSLLGRISAGLITGATNLNGAQSRAQVLVTVSTRQPNAEQLADALLASLKLSQADRAAYSQANDGLDIRDQLIAEFRKTGINYGALEYAGKGQYRGYVGMPKDIHQRLVELSKTDGQAPAEAAGTMSTKQQELRAQGAQTRHQLELQLRKAEAKQQIVDGVVGQGGAQIAGAAVMRAAPVLPELGPVAIGATLALPTIVTLDKMLDVAIERQIESGLMTPPPPLTANETDTKTKPGVPDIGELPTAGPLVPNAAPPVTATPSAPPTTASNQPVAPQGEPPTPRSPIDLARGIPTAITAASLGKLAADKMNQTSRTEPSMPSGQGRVTGTQKTGPQNPKTLGQIQNARGIRRENESAALLAAQGYVVEQNPPPKPNGRRPDFLIEGRYFDNYAPTSQTAKGVASGVKEKIEERQTERVILNLDDTSVTLQELREQITKYPITGLEEIIVVKDGQVVPFFPFN